MFPEPTIMCGVRLGPTLKRLKVLQWRQTFQPNRGECVLYMKHGLTKEGEIPSVWNRQDDLY